MAQETKHQRPDAGNDRRGAGTKSEDDADFEVDRNSLLERRRKTSETIGPSGTYRGRGPRSYRRRDER
ncbi:MAG TPA: hypothetical protein VF490_03465, partial [Chryseosolibacter sp.]